MIADIGGQIVLPLVGVLVAAACMVAVFWLGSQVLVALRDWQGGDE